MEVKLQNIQVGKINVDYGIVDRDKFVPVASLSRFLGIDRKAVLNIVSRVEPYKSMCPKLETRDSRGAVQQQVCIPLALLAGMLEKIKMSKSASGSALTVEKANYLMTCLTIIEQKTSEELFEMREDLLSMLAAEADEKEVFAQRAELSSRVRKSRKLKRGYYEKYQDRLNGQLIIKE